MTNEEAIYLLRRAECSGCRYLLECTRDERSFCFLAGEAGAKALEKQIPKKPVWDDTCFLCPTCGKKIHYSDYRNVPVCRECYQILDWSEA